MRKHLCMLSIVFITMLFLVQPVMPDTVVPYVINIDEHWTVEGSPYVAPQGVNIAASATLTIDPGVVVKVGEGHSIYVAGTLDAENVEFTKIDTDSTWGFIQFHAAGSNSSRLENCTIRHAVGSVNKFAILVSSGSPVISGIMLFDCQAEIGIYVQGGSPDIHSCILNGFSDCGVFVLGGAYPSVTGSTFSGNGYGIRVYYNSIYPLNPLFNGNTYANNDHGDLMITGWISGDVTWNEAPGTVYRTPGFGLSAAGSLTIGSGIIVSIDPDEEISVQGPLTATGVTFTRADPEHGWGYIGFEGAGADGSRLENCVFEYASGYPYNNITAIGLHGSSPMFKGCTIDNCTTRMGILVQNSSPEISGCTIRGLTDSGIYTFGDSLPLVFNNSFDGNNTAVKVSANGFGYFRGNTYSSSGSFGFNYLGTRAIDARYSYWGDPSGPYDPSDDTATGGQYNPSGLGDAVSDHVKYSPWVASIPTSLDGDTIPDDWELYYFLTTDMVHDESDVDMDGLTDLYEFAYGTNPDEKDSDDDGMPDGYEVGQHFNPIVDDGCDDADADRFSNLREYLSASDPRDTVDIPAIFADGDDDGDVDGQDLAGMAEELVTGGCSNCFYDLFPDAIVNDRDAFLFSEDFGRISDSNQI